MNATSVPFESLIDRVHGIVGTEPPRYSPLREDGPHDLDAIAEALRKTGIALTRFEAPVAVACSALDGERPLLTTDGEGRPLLVLSRLGPRVQTVTEGGETEWMSIPDLAERLGLRSVQREQAWVSLERPVNRKVRLKAKASPWANTLALLRGERSNIGAIVVYAVGVGLLSLALPLAVQTLVNTVAFGQLLQPIFVLTILLGAGLIMAASLTAMQTWVVEVVQRRIFVRLVSELSDRLPRVHVEAFERGSGPELLNRFFDIFTAQKAASGLLLGGMGALLTALVGVIVLAFYHPILLGFGLILSLSVVVVIGLLGRGATVTTVSESKAKYAVAGWLQEMARHPFALKMSGSREFARNRVDDLAAHWLRERGRHFRIYYRQLIAALGLQVIAHASLLGVGGWLVVERELAIGQLVAAELIVTAIVASLSKLSGKLETLYDLVAAVDKLGALLTVPLEEASGEASLGGSEGGASVEIADVFSQCGHLAGVTMSIAPGQRLGVQASRRTANALVDMLFALRLPAAGTIKINGEDIRDVDLDSLRATVGVVRNPEIMPASIAENVGAGRAQLTTSEIWALLRDAGLESVVRDLPEGIHTQLAPSGFPLDTNEMVRLTLARALASSPGLLVLDGVLDLLPENERATLLARVSEGRTTLTTTHEAAVANACEQTIRLGRISALEAGERSGQ